jgi:hypothetical protein
LESDDEIDRASALSWQDARNAVHITASSEPTMRVDQLATFKYSPLVSSEKFIKALSC